MFSSLLSPVFIPNCFFAGPKSSKKANDYDDLSSDGEDKKVSDHDSDDDDDDGPTVTFFVEPENATVSCLFV